MFSNTRLGLRVITSAAAMFLAADSNAQTSQCQWIGQVWTCNQQQRAPGINWGVLQPQTNIGGSFMDAFARGRQQLAEEEALAAQRDSYLAQQRAIREREDAASGGAVEQQTRDEESRLLGRQAGALVAAGQCSEAEKLAVQNGDFGLATTVRDYCAKK